jgi:hypothetical protein
MDDSLSTHKPLCRVCLSSPDGELHLRVESATDCYYARYRKHSGRRRFDGCLWYVRDERLVRLSRVASKSTEGSVGLFPFHFIHPSEDFFMGTKR